MNPQIPQIHADYQKVAVHRRVTPGVKDGACSNYLKICVDLRKLRTSSLFFGVIVHAVHGLTVFTSEGKSAVLRVATVR